MTNILKLSSLGLTGSHGQVFGFALKRLNTCHFVEADGALACLRPLLGTQVGIANAFDFVIEGSSSGGDLTSTQTGAV